MTAHTAVVPETVLIPPAAQPGQRRAGGHGAQLRAGDERTRVKEMLTYLAAVLPRFSSPAARLLALQCALRGDGQGVVRLPGGFLRGMRMHGRSELWRELEHAGWLSRHAVKPPHVEVRLLDPAVLTQAPGRSARRRAAHWALHPEPLATPRGTGLAVQLAALVLSVHSTADTGSAESETVTHLCGQSAQQIDDLFDQLARTRVLATWRRDRNSDDLYWRLPENARTASPQTP
ncbi:hypothetical protein ACWCO9_23075 [Streptomyces sp. NPDC001937]